MKKLLLFIALITLFAVKASAQQFDEVEFKKHLGKIGTLCDTVKSLRIISDTLTLLNMGGVYPNQKYTVVIRSNRITLDWVNLKGKVVCASGVFEIYKEQPQITIAEPNSIQVH